MAKVTITLEDVESPSAIDAKVIFDPPINGGANITGASAVGVSILELMSRLVSENGGEIETGDES